MKELLSRLFQSANSPLAILIGHRGLSAHFPENTIPAFAAALEKGASMIELDMRLSKDRQAVVIHDETVERTTNGKGMVKDLTLAEIQSLDAGFHFSKVENQYPFRGRGIVVPSLEQVFAAFPQALIAVELKENSEAACHALYELLKRFDRFDSTLVQVFSIDHKLGKLMRSLDKRIQTGHTTKEIVTFSTAARLKVTRLVKPKSPIFEVPMRLRVSNLPIVTAAFMKACRKRNIKVLVWTVNDEALIRKLYKMGAAGIYTDDVERSKAIIESVARETKNHGSSTK